MFPSTTRRARSGRSSSGCCRFLCLPPAKSSSSTTARPTARGKCSTASRLSTACCRSSTRRRTAEREARSASASSHARGTIVAIQDADLELDPVQLGSLVQPILDGEADVVYGSRFLTGRPPGPWISVAANRGLTWLTNVLFGGRLTDMETCYKIMAAPVARSLELESNRFDIEPEITAKLLRQRLPHRGAPGDLRSEKPRERQEDRLARRVPRDRRAAQIQIHGSKFCLRKFSSPELDRCRLRWRRRWPSRRSGFARGTYAAGGSDSSCYALMADAFAAGASAADERSRRAGAVARCAEDIYAGRIRCVGNESFGVGAGLRARVFSCCSRRSSRLAASTRSSSSRRLRVRCWSG